MICQCLADQFAQPRPIIVNCFLDVPIVVVVLVAYFPGREGGGGWYTTKFNMRRLRPEVQTLTLLYTIFDRKGIPFVYLLLTNFIACVNSRLSY